MQITRFNWISYILCWDSVNHIFWWDDWLTSWMLIVSMFKSVVITLYYIYITNVPYILLYNTDLLYKIFKPWNLMVNLFSEQHSAINATVPLYYIYRIVDKKIIVTPCSCSQFSSLPDEYKCTFSLGTHKAMLSKQIISDYILCIYRHGKFMSLGFSSGELLMIYCRQEWEPLFVSTHQKLSTGLFKTSKAIKIYTLNIINILVSKN